MPNTKTQKLAKVGLAKVGHDRWGGCWGVVGCQGFSVVVKGCQGFVRVCPTDFGQTRLWPNPTLPKPTLAKVKVLDV